MENILDRLSSYMKNKGLNNNKVTVQAGLSNGLLGNAFKSGRGLNSDSIEKILNAYPDINSEWLLTGKGSMLKDASLMEASSNIQYVRTSKVIEKKIESQEIPLYDLDASAGLNLLFSNRNQYIIATIRVPHIVRCDGALSVTGDSMYPLLASGDIVLFRLINNMEYMPFGDIFILSYEVGGDEHLVVKYVQRSNKEGYIRLVSHNPAHSPLDIPISSVTSIALVVASIRYHSMI